MDLMSEPTRRVLLAKPRGYCAGVDRAVQTVEHALERFGAPVYVRKQIVHNTHVVRTLEERGAIFVEETEEVPEGAVVVFSAHGVAPEVHEEAKDRSLRTIDATCPLVTKVHNEARRFAAQDYDILLIGHEGHEEVVGTTGEAPANIHLVDGPEDAAQIEVRDPAKVAWLSQTTLSVDETTETVVRAARAVPAADRSAERRHLLRDPEPAGRGQADRRRVRPGDRRRLAELLQLGAAGRGRPRRRRQAPPTWSTTRPAIDPAWLESAHHGRRHQRRFGARGPGRPTCSTGSPRPASRRRGGRGRAREHAVRAAARAPRAAH